MLTLRSVHFYIRRYVLYTCLHSQKHVDNDKMSFEYMRWFVKDTPIKLDDKTIFINDK